MTAKQRLASTATHLSPAIERQLIGTLKLAEIQLPIYETSQPTRLPLMEGLLDFTDSNVVEDLHWLLQKHLLHQDSFLISPPSSYSRLLALTFCSLIHTPYEFVSLHRDLSEGDLKQGREIRAGGRLEYVDSAVVRAVKNGSILILEGIERCERGVLPLLNNLLENREMNLEDGTHIVSARRFALMEKNGENTAGFIACSPDFRIIALGASVPPYPGFPLDPPFRSRFQSRYLDPLVASAVLERQFSAKTKVEEHSREVVDKVRSAIRVLQVKKEMQTKMASAISTADDCPPFPITSLLKLSQILSAFPLPSTPTPAHYVKLIKTIHPALIYVKRDVWRQLETALMNCGLEGADGMAEVFNEPDLGGLCGWSLELIERATPTTATVTFTRGELKKSIQVKAGPNLFLPFPLTSTQSRTTTPRFSSLLSTLVQLHSIKEWDISILPPSEAEGEHSGGSTSKSILIETFSELLGYELSTVHLYKELSGREIFMRRVVEMGEGNGTAGITSWKPSPLIEGTSTGALVHLSGIDTIGATMGTLSRLAEEREVELWEGKRIVGTAGIAGTESAHESFRIITTSSKSTTPKEFLTESLSSTFIALPTLAMSQEEESQLLLSYAECPRPILDQLLNFAGSYRTLSKVGKGRKLGTAGLKRIVRRIANFPDEGLHLLLANTLLSEFLPILEKKNLEDLMNEKGIVPQSQYYNPPPVVSASHLIFPAASDPAGKSKEYSVPLFDLKSDPEGLSSIPYVPDYLDNSNQTGLMRSVATDLELLGEHILFLGNQGAGKNYVIDRLLMLLHRPREYIQLHRDSTVANLMYQVSLSNGVISYTDSPLLRAIRLGRVCMIDEVDKASPPVIASLASLASRGEMTLTDGRRVIPNQERNRRDSDIVVHPNFRIILLGNRPGMPFLGNAFLRTLGDAFSVYGVSNPDSASESRLLNQIAPELDSALVSSLAGAFGDLRKAFDAGTINYPYSLRELLALVRHLKNYPNTSLEQSLRNIFDFDLNKPETLNVLYDILKKNGLRVEKIGIDAVRGQATAETRKIVEFVPTGDTGLDKPKFGKVDNKSHVGGNTWAGGSGGRDTAGVGGRGGYMRLVKKGQDIHQVSQELKDDVSDEIKNQAREMARKELAMKLAELDLTNGQASAYSQYYNSVESHINALVTFLENLETSKEERIWLKRQSDGELDETRLTEGLTGEAGIYKRRGTEKPELGNPQLKPKRIRFIFDLSASMYRNQFDGRLVRSLEAAILVMEAFSRLSNQEKYAIDIVGQSGEDAVVPLVHLNGLLTSNIGDRYKIVEKMTLIPQYVWSGDHTLEAITAGIEAVTKVEADDYFVVIITDANFERYGMTAVDLKRTMNANNKVKVTMIAIGEGAEAAWLPSALPGKAYQVKETSEIGRTLSKILSAILE